MADYESAAGLVSVWLLRRPYVAYVEVMTVSLWKSTQALHQFMKSQVSEYRGGVDYGAVRMEARTYELATLLEGKRRDVNVADPGSTE
jgi:heme-degrading monooxygenase HmoA